MSYTVCVETVDDILGLMHTSCECTKFVDKKNAKDYLAKMLKDNGLHFGPKNTSGFIKDGYPSHKWTRKFFEYKNGITNVSWR